MKRSTTTTAATHGNHENDGDSDGSCNRENNNCSAGSSAHSDDRDVLGGVRYVQVHEVLVTSQLLLCTQCGMYIYAYAALVANVRDT
jgi:hypothetical protein